MRFVWKTQLTEASSFRRAASCFCGGCSSERPIVMETHVVSGDCATIRPQKHGFRRTPTVSRCKLVMGSLHVLEFCMKGVLEVRTFWGRSFKTSPEPVKRRAVCVIGSVSDAPPETLRLHGYGSDRTYRSISPLRTRQDFWQRISSGIAFSFFCFTMDNQLYDALYSNLANEEVHLLRLRLLPLFDVIFFKHPEKVFKHMGGGVMKRKRLLKRTES
jgi:hypothetical protein